jgi:hypothetical protein
VIGAERAGRTAAERMRALRARKRAEREAAADAARRAMEAEGLRQATERAAAEQLDQVERALVESGQGGLVAGQSVVDRVLAGSRELLLRAWGNPLIRMAALASADPAELARRLGCEPIEVLRLQQAANAELLDRLFGKPSQALRVDGSPAMAVQIAVSPQLAETLGVRVAERQEIQGVAEEARA